MEIRTKIARKRSDHCYVWVRSYIAPAAYAVLVNNTEEEKIQNKTPNQEKLNCTEYEDGRVTAPNAG